MTAFRRAGVVAGCALAAMLASCAAGPTYHRPAVEIPINWTASEASGDAWPTATWWQAFGDAQLNRLEEQAASRNHDLKAAQARIVEAAAQARVAGADLFPSLTFDAQTGWSKPFSKGGQQQVRQYQSYQLGLTASYTADLFGENRSKAASGRAALAAATYDEAAVELTLSAAVANTYFAAGAAADRLAAARNAADAARETLRLLQVQHDNGTLSDFELSVQQSQLATIEAAVPVLETDRRQALTALAILVGELPQQFSLDPVTLQGLAQPVPPAGLPSALLEHRPDVARAEAQLVGANADLRAAIAARYPHISLTANGGTGSLALSNLLNPASFFYNIFADLAATLFDGGRLQGESQYAKARYDELVETYRQAVLSAFGDTQNALDAQQQTILRLERQAEATSLADRAAKLAGVRYRGGSASYIDYLDSQRTRFSSQDALVQARLARLLAAVSVYQALGGGWSGQVTNDQLSTSTSGSKLGDAR